MIFVDANVPLYLIGDDESLKGLARKTMERLVNDGERLVTDAEVLQEIMHWCASIRRWRAIDEGFEALLKVVDEVFPIDRRDTERAKEILLNDRNLSDRVAIHAAVMERHGIVRIASFDSSFDRVSGITRV